MTLNRRLCVELLESRELLSGLIEQDRVIVASAVNSTPLPPQGPAALGGATHGDRSTGNAWPRPLVWTVWSCPKSCRMSCETRFAT